jgi:hypothetical protein
MTNFTAAARTARTAIWRQSIVNSIGLRSAFVSPISIVIRINSPMLEFLCPAEGYEPPTGVKSYLSRTFANVATASTKRQSISTRTCSQEKLETRLFTLQSPFLVPILKTVSAVSRSVRSLSRARTWKGAIASVAAILLLGSTGCFTDLTIAINKGHAGTQPPPPPIVPCEQPHHEGEH